MSSLWTTSTPTSGSPGSVPSLPHTIGPDLSLEPGTSSGQGINGDILVDMDGLSVLSQVVQT